MDLAVLDPCSGLHRRLGRGRGKGEDEWEGNGTLGQAMNAQGGYVLVVYCTAIGCKRRKLYIKLYQKLALAKSSFHE